MKTINLKNILLLVFGLVVLNSCVEDDDFNTPNLSIEEPDLGEGAQLIQISAVAGDLAQAQGGSSELDYTNENIVFTFPSDGAPKYMTGYVISSDEGGNFFKEIIIQDNFENPTVGLRISIDVNPTFVRYEIGRKIFVKVNGKAVGIRNGILTFGEQDGNRVGRIAASQEEKVIKRSTEVETIVPMVMEINDFQRNKTNLFIRLEDVQFNRAEALSSPPKTFAAEATDQFDGNRLIEDCNSINSVLLKTSTFADFKSLRLPAGRGNIDAVLTRDFQGANFNVVVSTPESINLDNEERCDPIELACGLASSAGTNNLFSDDFETQTINTLISGNGWTNFIEAGTKGWEAFTQGGTNASLGISARVGSFQSGNDSSIAWLITPQIDLDTNEGVTLQFQTSNSFSDGSIMEVLFSNDWDGTESGISLATWGIISDAFIVQDDDFFGAWFDSGIVDLSCGSGQIHIAFKYTGSGETAFDGTYELDLISIDAQ